MTHTIKDILREGIEEFEALPTFTKKITNFDIGEERIETYRLIDPNWLKAHDQKLLQAVLDTVKGMKKTSNLEDITFCTDSYSSLDEIETYTEELLKRASPVIYNQAISDLIASITPIEV